MTRCGEPGHASGLGLLRGHGPSGGGEAVPLAAGLLQLERSLGQGGGDGAAF